MEIKRHPLWQWVVLPFTWHRYYKAFRRPPVVGSRLQCVWATWLYAKLTVSAGTWLRLVCEYRTPLVFRTTRVSHSLTTLDKRRMVTWHVVSIQAKHHYFAG